MTDGHRRDLHQDLAEQLAFLDVSCASYDAGMRSEAKRLAVTIRVLVHDTASSQSLLWLLGIKHKLLWLFSGGGVNAGNLLSTSSLCVQRITIANGQGSFQYAPLNPEDMLSEGWLVPFDSWWETPVIKDRGGETFTRRGLVLALANKDGGAHIDRLQGRVRALAHEGSLGWHLGTTPGDATVDAPPAELITVSPLLASVRTIAEEVRQSLLNQGDITGLPAHCP